MTVARNVSNARRSDSSAHESHPNTSGNKSNRNEATPMLHKTNHMQDDAVHIQKLYRYTTASQVIDIHMTCQSVPSEAIRIPREAIRMTWREVRRNRTQQEQLPQSIFSTMRTASIAKPTKKQKWWEMKFGKTTFAVWAWARPILACSRGSQILSGRLASPSNWKDAPI